MHVDASAMVALILEEDGHVALSDRLAKARQRSTSAVSVLETIIAIGRVTGDRAAGLMAAQEFLASASIKISMIDGQLIDRLADAQLRYGKGSGSAARLNLGDCFSYALAKQNKVALLYKGDDFAQTDLA